MDDGNKQAHDTAPRDARAVTAAARPGARRRALALLGARGQAGMTLIEIMVVVIIMGLIASAVGFGVFNYLKKAKKKTTEQAIEVVRSAVRLYQNDHPNQCPSMQQLQQEGFVDRNRSTVDGWGRPFRISCDNGDVTVTSDGEDGRAGTDDDLPGPAAGGAGGGGGGTG